MPSDESSELDLSGALYKKASQKRYNRTKRGYTMDRWLFRAVMWAIFAWCIVVAKYYNFNLDYYRCDRPAGEAVFYTGLSGQMQVTRQDIGCLNPFYKPDLTWKTLQYLPPGEYGNKPGGPMWQSVFYVPIIALAGALGLNHLIHNRRRSRR